MSAMSCAPDRYAVIGHPIGHSQSPRIHGMFAAAAGQHMVYEAIDGGQQADGFALALAAFRAAGGKGLNVTLPFKLQALACADVASDDARLAGAANALRFGADGLVEAQNFDGAGLVRDITHNLGLPLAGKRVLLLGAGGAARGALAPLARAQAACIHIANRSAGKAVALARELAPRLAVPLQGGSLPQLAQAGGFDVVINATSASLSGSALALPAAVFAPGALAYDMVYGKGLTPFLRTAQAAGCARLADGAGMLVEQAAEAFAWWRGVRPDTRAALQALGGPLAPPG